MTTKQAEEGMEMSDDVGTAPNGAWLPIEGAPKEHGHEILVACNCPHMMAVVEWIDAEKVDDELNFITGWYISDGHNDPIWFRANPYMTHWMPLPAPPAYEEIAERERSSNTKQAEDR